MSSRNEGEPVQAIPDPDLAVIYANCKAQLPKEHLNWLGVNVDGGENERRISLHPKEMNGEKVIVIKKHALKAVALLAIAAMLPFILAAHQAAYAQQRVVESPSPTVAQNQAAAAGTGSANIGQTVFSVSQLTFDLQGPSAYLPLRIEVTYPTGQGLIQNITTSSPQTVHTISSTAGFPSPGLTTTTFQTGSPDTFNIVLGQQYNQDISQVAYATVYANNTVVNKYQIPIVGSSFTVHFTATTQLPPRQLSPEELQAPTTTRLDRVEGKVDHVAAKMVDVAEAASSATNASRISLLPISALTIIVTAMAVAVIRLNRKYERAFKRRPAVAVAEATVSAGGGAPLGND